MNVLQTQINIYNFLAQFATPYLEKEVPDEITVDGVKGPAPFPYLTYVFDIENWRTTGIAQIRLWDIGESTQKLFQIAENIEDEIGEGYIEGNLVIHAGSPFIQIIPQEDENIKCLYMNLEINYL